ncbi:hypothetical protein GQ53DRAFT_775212 [Thozetella sp. PMI_491]|nr:hypothetical protein GQ53DRAFT_775212 [Thozetella sp. PMI_491]
MAHPQEDSSTSGINPGAMLPAELMFNSKPRVVDQPLGLATPVPRIRDYRETYPNLDADPEPHKKVDHQRKRKRNPSNDPKQVYLPPAPSKGWGPRDKRGRHLFRYNPKHVELAIDLRFSTQEALYFFSGTKAPNNQPPNRSGLTIWIQNAPAQTNQRYHSGSASSKCRWASCADPKYTILKGFWRVAFDENSDRTGRDLDPFINAGYMHLFCLEKSVDLVDLMQRAEATHEFRVLPDTRTFPKETRNPMAITRDHHEIYRIFNKWKATQYRKHAEFHREFAEANPGVPHRRRPYAREDCLWYWLTSFHLDHEVKGRSETRVVRDGADIAKHRGDLVEYIRLKEEKKEQLAEAEAEAEDEADWEPSQHTSWPDQEYVPPSRQGATQASRKLRQVQREPKTPTRQLVLEFPAMAKFGLQPAGATPRTPRPAKRRPVPLDLGKTQSGLYVSVLSRTVEELQHRPMTRKRSREVAELIEHEARSPMTRQCSKQLSPLLESHPTHLRDSLEQAIGGDRSLLGPQRPYNLDSLPPSKKRKVKRSPWCWPSNVVKSFLHARMKLPQCVKYMCKYWLSPNTSAKSHKKMGSREKRREHAAG